MPSAYRLSAATGLHKGDRDYQQDQVALLSHPHAVGCVLAVLADGMGGRSGGRKASNQVMMTAKQLFDRYTPQFDDAEATLIQLVREAHTVIRLTAVSAEEEPHSTVAAFLIKPAGDCHWVHSGDSRVYHYFGDQLVKRTLDHSYVQTLINQGQITEAQAATHPQSNILTGCLGSETDPPAPTHFIPQLRVGDILMACSDGIWHHFDSAEIGALLSGHSAREACELLIDRAHTRSDGGSDNLSVVVVKVEALGS